MSIHGSRPGTRHRTRGGRCCSAPGPCSGRGGRQRHDGDRRPRAWRCGRPRSTCSPTCASSAPTIGRAGRRWPRPPPIRLRRLGPPARHRHRHRRHGRHRRRHRRRRRRRAGRRRRGLGRRRSDWHPADGRETWSYTWTPAVSGQVAALAARPTTAATWRATARRDRPGRRLPGGGAVPALGPRRRPRPSRRRIGPRRACGSARAGCACRAGRSSACASVPGAEPRAASMLRLAGAATSRGAQDVAPWRRRDARASRSTPEARGPRAGSRARGSLRSPRWRLPATRPATGARPACASACWPHDIDDVTRRRIATLLASCSTLAGRRGSAGAAAASRRARAGRSDPRHHRPGGPLRPLLRRDPAPRRASTIRRRGRRSASRPPTLSGYRS